MVLEPAFVPKKLFQGDQSESNDAVKMKRTYGRRRRYEELQSVSYGGVEYPTTSCSVRLANGAEPGALTTPTARLPPRLMAKDMWPEADREQPPPQDWDGSTEQGPGAWGPARERRQDGQWSSVREQPVHSGQDPAWGAAGHSNQGKADQAWMRAQPRGAEQGWASGRGQVHNQTWNLGRDPEAAGRGQDQVWRDQETDRGLVWRPGTSSVTSTQSKVVQMYCYCISLSLADIEV